MNAASEGPGAARAGDGSGPGDVAASAGRPTRATSTDALAAIPWRYRLFTKLLAITFTVLVVGVMAFAVTEKRFQDALLAQMESGAELFSHTIDRATTRAMLENRLEDAYDTMRSIGAQPGVERVRFFNKEGRITFSTDPKETGAMVDKGAEACFACHTAGQPLTHLPSSSRARVFQLPEHRVMGFIKGIYNEPRCATAECHHHARGEQVLGVLDVSVSLEDVDRRIAAFRAWSVILTAVGILLLGGTFLLLARAHVVRPVTALVAGIRRVAREERDVEIQVRSKGELGLLAASFNDMARGLQRADDELRSLNQGLERKVEERTAELSRAQAALVQSEKLSSLGRLSASIAHEINNPLAGILTFAKVLIRDAEKDVPDPERRKLALRNLSLVQRETERCSAIVRNLLDFARERPMTLGEVDLVLVLEEALQLVAHQIQMQGHTLEKHLQPVPRVQADFGQLRQALVNVILNGCEAMARGGRLGVATAPSADGRWAMVEVSDTGPGIAEENLSRVFDPFFTTKEKGTGLGLSVVYGIVQRLGGTVEVASEPGQGTRFTFRLPAVQAAAA